MPEPWQSFNQNDDSSSIYTTDGSFSRPRELHSSLFVEDFDEQGSRDRPRGISVYLDDSRFEELPTPPELSSTDSSDAIADGAVGQPIEVDENRSGNAGVTQFGNAVAAYRMVNDSAFTNSAGQTLDDTTGCSKPSEGPLSSISPNQQSSNLILPQAIEQESRQVVGGPQPVVVEEPRPIAEDNNMEHLAQSSVRSEYKGLEDSPEESLPLPPPVHADDQSNYTEDSAGVATYQTVNDDSVGGSLVDSLQQHFQDAHDEIDVSEAGSDSRQGSSGVQTVSTSILISGEEDDAPVESPRQNELQNIEDMVKMLEDEVQQEVAPLSCSTRPTSAVDFVPQDFKLSKRSASVPSSPQTPSPCKKDEKRSKFPQSPSLLNKILIPIAADPNGVEIPVLRPVMESPKEEEEEEEEPPLPPPPPPLLPPAEEQEPKAEPPPSAKQEPAGKEEPPRQAPSGRLVFPAERASLEMPELTNSELDLALESLKRFQDELRLKVANWEAAAGRKPLQEPKPPPTGGYIPGPMPAQRVDSSSVRSPTASSMDTAFAATYSVSRIVLVLLGCMFAPPFFFMIAVGRRAGFSDYKIMRMITRPKYRETLLQGFLWGIDVSWFRWMCLGLGVFETLGAFAGIAVGFGVGLGT